MLRCSCILLVPGLLLGMLCLPAVALPSRAVPPGSDPLVAGQALTEKGDHAGAREVFRDIIKSNPGNVEARRLLVLSYLQNDDIKEALHGLDELLQALNARPDNPTLWQLSGDITATQILSRRVFNRTYERASRLLFGIATAFSARPELTDKHQQDTLRKLNEMLVSLITTHEELRKGNATPDVRSERTREIDVAIKGLAIDLAGTFYAKAAAVAPKDPAVPVRAASFYLRLCNEAGNQEYAQDALAAAKKARELAPCDTNAIMLTARSSHLVARAVKTSAEDPLPQEKVSLLQASLDAYREALQIRPFLSDALDDLASVYAELNKLTEGEQFFRAAAEAAGDPATRSHAAFCVPRMYDAAKLSDQAEAHWRRLADDFPDSIEPYVNLIRLCQITDKSNDKAVKLLEETVSKHPDLLNVHVWLGDLHRKIAQDIKGKAPKTGAKDDGPWAQENQKAEEAYQAALKFLNSDASTCIVLREDTAESGETTRRRLFHRAVMGLSSMYIENGEPTKAGDFIDHYRGLYWKRDVTADAERAVFNTTAYEPREIAAEAAMQEGYAYLLGGERGKAETLLTEAINLKAGRYYPAQRQLANVYLVIQSLPNVRFNERVQAIEKATAVWRQIAKDRPNDVAAQFQLATLLSILGQRMPAEPPPADPNAPKPDENKAEQPSGPTREALLAECLSMLNGMLAASPANANARLLRASLRSSANDWAGSLEDAGMMVALKVGEALTSDPVTESGDTETGGTVEPEPPDVSGLRPCTDKEIAALHARAYALMAWAYLVGTPDLAKAEELAGKAAALEPRITMLNDVLAWLNYQKALAAADKEAANQLLKDAASFAAKTTTDFTGEMCRALYHRAEILLALNQGGNVREEVLRFARSAIGANPFAPEAKLAEALVKRLESKPAESGK